MRLTRLHLASRSTRLAAGYLVTLSILMSLGLLLGDNDTVSSMLLTIAPVGVAAVVGVSLRSPFGEVERIASASLATLRLEQVSLLLGLAGISMSVGASIVATSQIAGTIVRNGAGYVGLALLGAWLLGAAVSWLPALAYGGGVLIADSAGLWTGHWWMWPAEPPSSGSALAIALLTLAAGVATSSIKGEREPLPDGP